MKLSLLIAAGLGLALNLAAADATDRVEKWVAPPPAREFRAEWIATVGNSCWPSKPGLSSAQQMAELVAILDRAAALKLNAVIFQVRPACDALYASPIEPWSEYLTGLQGRAPWPYYDPLAFAITEAHKRGLELHAWFNPFRAHHFQSVSPIAPDHVSRTHPELVRNYGRYLWLDPGEPAVRDYSLRVVMDVVRRYDVDGIHIDDYFYPYAETNAAGVRIDFPDEASWKKFGAATGLTRGDWRRRNVDIFVEQVYRAIKAQKPWVKFGISPFGIWRPKNPPGIKGFDAYEEIYCDSLKWLRAGWCDYLAPQLYWGISPPQTSFAALLDWWNSQNVRRRHVWPGMDSLKVGGKWPPSEIINQIELTRRSADPGHVHWSSTALMKNAELDRALANEVYCEHALVPASPWLGASNPPMPKLSVDIRNQSVHVAWQNAGGEPARWWVLQNRAGGSWTTRILSANCEEVYLDSSDTEAISLRAVNRVGRLSDPAIWTPKKYLPADTTHGATRMKN